MVSSGMLPGRLIANVRDPFVTFHFLLSVLGGTSHDLGGSPRKQSPYALHPIEVFRLHQHRTQACECFAVAFHSSKMLLPEMGRQFRSEEHTSELQSHS